MFLNPEIWTKSVLGHVGRLTKFGGTCSSFTFARSVRERLIKAGFVIERQVGFGTKRDMLVGKKPGSSSYVKRRLKVGIIGGGVAGAAVAAGLRHRGEEVTIIDKGSTLATGASGNRLALQTPRLTLDHNFSSQLSLACIDYAASCSDKAKATITKKIISLDWPQREAFRQEKFSRQKWPKDLMSRLDSDKVSRYVGVSLPLGAVVHDIGRVINPVALCSYLALGAYKLFNTQITKILSDRDGVKLNSDNGHKFFFDKVVIATGANLSETLSLLGINRVPVSVTNGRVSYVPEQASLCNLSVGLSFGGYLTPSYRGFHELGATFDREKKEGDNSLNYNRELLPPALKNLFDHLENCKGRSSQRASMPDRNPVMGQLADNIYILGATGSRGFTLAPLLGEYLAAEIASTPNCLNTRFKLALNPYRFQ